MFTDLLSELSQKQHASDSFMGEKPGQDILHGGTPGGQLDHYEFAARKGVLTPLMISHSASGTSNASIGSHMIVVIGPLRNPTACKGRPITNRTDATRPVHASGMGIIRPRTKRYEKSVLPTAKKIAVTATSPRRRYAPRTCVAAASGALTPLAVASQAKAGILVMEEPAITPSPTRQASPNIARSLSCSRVIA